MSRPRDRIWGGAPAPDPGRYAAYYNESRIHRSLDKDAPFRRTIEHFGVITSQPVLGAFITNIAESDFRHAQPAHPERVALVRAVRAGGHRRAHSRQGGGFQAQGAVGRRNGATGI